MCFYFVNKIIYIDFYFFIFGDIFNYFYYFKKKCIILLMIDVLIGFGYRKYVYYIYIYKYV